MSPTIPPAGTTAVGHTPIDGARTTRVGIANDRLLIVSATYPGQRSRFAKDLCDQAENGAFATITRMMGSSQTRCGRPRTNPSRRRQERPVDGSSNVAAMITVGGRLVVTVTVRATPTGC